jgi:WD40 repeat protein
LEKRRCVQGKAIGWDLPSCKKKFVINVGGDGSQMNTINSVNIWEEKELISVGSRDGICRFYDVREPTKPVYTLKAHVKGLNKIDFSRIDQTFYTSGRDNKINIWDIRFFKNDYKSRCPEPQNVSDTGVMVGREPLLTLSNHSCETHHIQSGYMLNSKYIITGSEEDMV